MTAARWAAAALLLAGATPALARTVDYSRSEAEMQRVAADLEAPALIPAAARGTADVVLEDGEKLDHEVLILAISCRAWEVVNPLSQMVRRALGDWDRDGLLEPVADRLLLHVRIQSARSTLRCVQVAELEERCIVRTAVEGEARLERPGAEPRTERFALDHQHVQTPSIGCGGLSNGTAISGWTVSMQLVERLQRMLTD